MNVAALRQNTEINFQFEIFVYEKKNKPMFTEEPLSTNVGRATSILEKK